MEGIGFYGEVVWHCLRVGKMVGLVCEEIGWDVLVNELQEAASLHDIGKFYVKKSVLDAPRSLTGIERGVVDMHSMYGYLACRELGYRESICQLVLVHHGVGKWFVDRKKLLSGVEESHKILMGCDIFDALTSDRVYRKAMSREVALETMLAEGEIPEDICRAIYRVSKLC